MAYEYRPLEPGEEPALFETVGHALNASGMPWEPFADRIGRENLRGIFRSGRLVGGLGVYRMGQWFGGRVLPCGGFSIVGVAPEERGQGAARLALVSLLQELHADGTPLACLYASSQRVYRAVGFEQAGSCCRYELPLSSIGVSDRALPVTHVADDDCRLFVPVADERARLTNGNLARTPGLWQRIRDYRGARAYACIIGDADAPQGYVVYGQADEAQVTKLLVHDMAALTPAAGRRLWTFIADHRSIARRIAWTGPPTEPLLCFPQECKHTPIDLLRWMLRIVDVPEALRARGYPPGAHGELHLEVADQLLPANHGRFVLSVAEGIGHVRAGGNGNLRLDVRGLAPLYSSFLSAYALRSIGWLDGDDAAVSSAAALFAGPEPWMTEIF